MTNEISVTVVTDSPLWSMGNGRGAPSMFLTIKQYSLIENVNLIIITSEERAAYKDIKYNKFYKVPDRKKLQNINSIFLRYILKYPYWIWCNICALYYLYIINPSGIIYAYEIGFVPACKFFKLLKPSVKLVTRFQGTILSKYLLKGKISWIAFIRKFDHVVALRAKADLVIMTNDGTLGDTILKCLHNNSETLFLKNGLGWPFDHKLKKESEICLKKRSDDEIIFATSSRLVSWKRVDRSIKIFARVHEKFPNSTMYILGDGDEYENLKQLVLTLPVGDKVKFLGALPYSTATKILNDVDFFLSSYELTNVGNPLWEAISSGCKIVTLSNGDTPKYITDGITGIMSSEDRYMDNAEKVIQFLESDCKQELVAVLPADFVSWSDRLTQETQKVLGL